jgi:cell division protein FtsW (lipid II flippase)
MADPEGTMIVLGIILLVIGFVVGINILWTIGLILVVVGAILWILGAVGRGVGGRRHYW